MTKLNKILYLLMVFTLLFLLSCGDSDDKNSSGNPGNQQENDQAEDRPAEEAAENLLYADDLPEKDYKGEKFSILTFGNLPTAHIDILIEEQTGETVDDAIYLANRLVQDRFNLEFEQTAAENYDAVPGILRNIVRSGENAYDFVLIADRHAMNLAMEGKYFYRMNELPYVNLDKLYWDQSLKTDMTVGGNLYFTYGANMLSSYDFVCFLVFNKQMVSELGLENIYDLVNSGKWTIDKMYEMAAAATQDIDGNGKMTDQDRYGVLCSSNWYYPNFWGAERIPIIAKDKDDMPYFNVPGNEKLFTLFDKLYGCA